MPQTITQLPIISTQSEPFSNPQQFSTKTPFSTSVPKATNTSFSTSAPKAINTLLPSPQPTSTLPLGKVKYIIRGRDSMEAAASILTRFLDKNFSIIADFHDLMGYLSLSQDGNSLREVTYNTSKGFNITEISFLTLHPERFIALVSSDLTPEDQSFDYQLSPDKKWIAYKKISTEEKFAPWDAEVQDVMLLKVDFTVPQTPIQLSKHGWAKPAFLVWSPNGRYLIFTDLDSLGRIQIFLYDVQMQQKIQVSNFTETNNQVEVGEFSWRQDGESVAFYRSIYNDSQIQMNPNERIGVISLSDYSTKWISVSGLQNLYSHNSIVWDNSGEQFTLLVNDFANTPQYSQSLLWIKPDQNTWKISTIPQNFIKDLDLRPLQMCKPFSIDKMVVGFVTNGALVFYNYQNEFYTLFSLAPILNCAEILITP